MRTILPSTAIGAGCATIAMLLAKTETVMADPRLEEIQALVCELRNVGRETPVGVYVALQEVADRLETLPGIVPVPNANWQTWKSRIGEIRSGLGLPRRLLTLARNKSSRLVCMSAQRAGPPDG